MSLSRLSTMSGRLIFSSTSSHTFTRLSTHAFTSTPLRQFSTASSETTEATPEDTPNPIVVTVVPSPQVSLPTSVPQQLLSRVLIQPRGKLATGTVKVMGRASAKFEWAVKPNPQILSLSNLLPTPGKTRARVGRGPSSGYGKTAGRGHKGQNQRHGVRKRGFIGGQTPFWRQRPKYGSSTYNRYQWMLEPVTIKKIITFIKEGRIDGSQVITMKTLLDSGCCPKIKHGVKLLSEGVEELDRPLHLQVTDTSEPARQALEAKGGSVHLVWFNRVTLKAHLNPTAFLRKYGRLPKFTGVPPPKIAEKYGYYIQKVSF